MIIGSHCWVEWSTDGDVFEDIRKVPENQVGLVLGTSKHAKEGGDNLFFTYRMEAAVELFRAGKIQHILVSGDNHTKWYNEPSSMKKVLMKKGIPSEKIHLDYAGFRTLDSVIRSKKIFGQDSITIVSQDFHAERAVFLAQKNGIKAVGYSAKDLSQGGLQSTHLREYLARVRAVIDVIIGKEPKFLGKKVPIP